MLEHLFPKIYSASKGPLLELMDELEIKLLELLNAITKEDFRILLSRLIVRLRVYLNFVVNRKLEHCQNNKALNV